MAIKGCVTNGSEVIIQYNNREESTVNLKGYTDLNYISNGANGVVLAGINTITNRKDAIKIYVPRNGRNKDFFDKFLDEIRKIAQISDPSIVTIYNAEMDDAGLPICYLQYIDGVTLKNWLKKNTSYEDRLIMAKRILEAILLYQGKGIIHGDIHANNIMIDNADNVHIIDFGTSTFSNRENQSKERECYFVYHDIADCLGEAFDEKLFLFRSNQKGPSGPYEENDVRYFEPLLVTKTLYYYVSLKKRIYETGTPVEAVDFSEILGFVSNMIYPNLKEVVDLLVDISGDKYDKSFIAQTIIDNYQDQILGIEGKGFDYDTNESIIRRVFYIYYDIVREGFAAEYKNQARSSEHYDLIQSAIENNTDIKEVVSRKDMDEIEDLKEEMFSFLKKHMGFGELVYILWIKYNEFQICDQ